MMRTGARNAVHGNILDSTQSSRWGEAMGPEVIYRNSLFFRLVKFRLKNIRIK